MSNKRCFLNNTPTTSCLWLLYTPNFINNAKRGFNTQTKQYKFESVAFKLGSASPLKLPFLH